MEEVAVVVAEEEQLLLHPQTLVGVVVVGGVPLHHEVLK